MIDSTFVATVRALASRLERSWHSEEYSRAVASELDAHISLETAANIRHGRSPSEARREALVRFGGLQQTRERCLEEMTFRWMVRWRRR